MTHYKKDDVGGSLIAEVQCAEHHEVAVCSEQYQPVRLTQAAEPAA